MVGTGEALLVYGMVSGRMAGSGEEILRFAQDDNGAIHDDRRRAVWRNIKKTLKNICKIKFNMYLCTGDESSS